MVISFFVVVDSFSATANVIHPRAAAANRRPHDSSNTEYSH